MNYNEEQDALFMSYLNSNIISSWKNNYYLIKDNQKTKRDISEYIQTAGALDLVITDVCNTECSYCYYKNFGAKYLYSKDSKNKEDILNNCRKLFNSIRVNKYVPSDVEIFSGEFLNLPYAEEILNIINDGFSFLSGTRYREEVILPTNATFCYSDEGVKKVQDLVDSFNNDPTKNINVYLSLSGDGKFLDNETRRFRDKKKKYDDAFYDRLFKFSQKNDYRFHPMISAKSISHWIENFDWYIENIKKYFGYNDRQALGQIYLLEVRNPDWKEEDLDNFDKFLNYLIDKTFEACNNSPEEVYKFYVDKHNYNIISSLFTDTGRGLGCGLQSTLEVRMGDLAIMPCHRTSYKGLLAGNLIIDDEGNLSVKAKNCNLYMLVKYYDSRTTTCNDCAISNLCSGPCLGSNYEVNRDLFKVSPMVCKMEFRKIQAIIKGFIRHNALEYFITKLSDSLYLGSVNDLESVTNTTVCAHKYRRLKRIYQIEQLRDYILKTDPNMNYKKEDKENIENEI